MSRLEAHYRAVVDRYGYDRVDVGLDDVPASLLRRKFVAVDGSEALAAALDRPTLAATGVGMTGPPHLGTVGQVYNALTLQRTGLDVQFVLADLEPYHGGADLDRVRELAERYRRFLLDLGFDPDAGWLRTQEEAREVMHTAQLLAPYYRPEEREYLPESGNECADGSTEWWAAVRDAYESVDAERDPDDPDARTGPTSEAANTHSAMLHVADFLHPLLKEGYEQVIVALGVDEHALTLSTRNFLRDLPVEGRVVGLHGRMVTGLGDSPKMGRSLPRSAIHLSMSPAEIRERLTDPANDADERPADSLVFQSMCLASEYGTDELDRLEVLCREGGEPWEDAKAEYAAFVSELAETWQATK